VDKGREFFRCEQVYKTSDVLKFMVCPHGQREPVRHWADKGEGVNFSRLCADVFYGQLLWICSIFADLTNKNMNKHQRFVNMKCLSSVRE